MNKKNIFPRTLLACTIGIALGAPSFAAEDRGPAYQIIEVAELADEIGFGPTPTAISSADGNRIVAFGARFLMSDGFDETLRYVWNISCPYSTEVCSFQWNGFEGQDNGFRFYREARLNAGTNGYESSLLAFMVDSSGQTSNSPAVIVSDSDKITVFDDEAPGSTDVMITALNHDGSIMAGNETGPYRLKNGIWVRDFVRRGFIADSNGTLLCELMPDLSNLPADDNRGGLSAVYGLTETVDFGDGQPRTIAVGLRDNGRPDGDWDAFNDCEFDDADLPGDATACPGFTTQAALWDITACLNGPADSEVEGMALASEYLSAESDDYPIANAHAINTSGIAVGASAFEVDGSARGTAVVFEMEPDGSGNLVIKNDKPVAIPMRSADSSSQAPSEDFFAQIQNAWAVDINDRNQVVGNVYYAVSRNRNKAYEFFIYDYDTPNTLASFPLRNDPIDGANSFANRINNNGLVVGWRDAAGDTRPSFLGSPRDQEGFLFDSNSDNGSTYNLNDLVCSVDSGQAVRPLYRILEATDITDDGVILAKATRFASEDDWSNRVNGTALVIKLQPDGDFVSLNTGEAISIDAAECPETEEESFTRSGAAVPPWVLMLLGLLGAFRFTKRKSFVS